MELYAGIDLHCNNSVVTVIDEQDRTVYAKRLPNDLERIVAALRAAPGEVRGVAVESTFNWYWLVDGLKPLASRVHLVNTAAVKQYDGLKHGGDFSDARQLAHLLRLGILPVGYIYPREERAVRDLLRKRSSSCASAAAQILSIENLIARNLGSARAAATRSSAGMPSSIDAMDLLDEQQPGLEGEPGGDELHRRPRSTSLSAASWPRSSCARTSRRSRPSAALGEILALTIVLETGDIGRFAGPGNFASYARWWTAAAIQRQEEGRGQRQVRQQAPGLGLHRGGALRRALRRDDQALVPEEVRQPACPSWPSRRWRTSWRGPATT